MQRHERLRDLLRSDAGVRARVRRRPLRFSRIPIPQGVVYSYGLRIPCGSDGFRHPYGRWMKLFYFFNSLLYESMIWPFRFRFPHLQPGVTLPDGRFPYDIANCFVSHATPAGRLYGEENRFSARCVIPLLTTLPFLRRTGIRFLPMTSPDARYLPR